MNISDQFEMLDEQCKIVVRARREDPDVSHEAAELLEAQQEKLKHSIATVLNILGKHEPCSDFQIREHWSEFWGSIKPWSEHLPRMARLWAEREGKIVQAGETIHKGRRCRTWKLGSPETIKALDCCPTCGRIIRKRTIKQNTP